MSPGSANGSRTFDLFQAVLPSMFTGNQFCRHNGKYPGPSSVIASNDILHIIPPTARWSLACPRLLFLGNSAHIQGALDHKGALAPTCIRSLLRAGFYPVYLEAIPIYMAPLEGQRDTNNGHGYVRGTSSQIGSQMQST